MAAAEMGRRVLLVGALSTVASGCANFLSGKTLRGTVRIAVPWSGQELVRFRRLLDDFPDYATEVFSLGDDIGAVLGARASGAPDVVLLPRPGLAEQHVQLLQPLDFTQWGDRVADPRRWRVALPDGQLLGVPFKLAHKSTVWFRTDLFARLGLSAPTSWRDWLDLNRRLIAAGETPLALPAADGWMLTDFFENVLLGARPDVYRGLAEGSRSWSDPAVEEALRTLAEMWAMPGALLGGSTRSLTMQFEESLVEVFARGRAAMVVAPDFAYPVIQRFAGDTSRASVFRFPAQRGGREPLVIGGDIAVLRRGAGEGGHQLIKWLARPSVAAAWVREGGFLSPSPQPGYPPQIAPLAAHVATGDFEFDLSDRLGALGGGDGSGLWQVLQDFLQRIGDRSRPDELTDAVHGAIGSMIEKKARYDQQPR